MSQPSLAQSTMSDASRGLNIKPKENTPSSARSRTERPATSSRAPIRRLRGEDLARRLGPCDSRTRQPQTPTDVGAGKGRRDDSGSSETTISPTEKSKTSPARNLKATSNREPSKRRRESSVEAFPTVCFLLRRTPKLMTDS